MTPSNPATNTRIRAVLVFFGGEGIGGGRCPPGGGTNAPGAPGGGPYDGGGGPAPITGGAVAGS
ncbi:hypothetical protein GCM10023223_52800 [Stackebrandtia albiflava]